MPRLALALALIAAVAAALWALSGADLTTDGLRRAVAAADAWRDANPLAAAAAAFAAYVAVTALSLPVAVWMTLGIGALFGFWTGLVIVSFAASIGATLAFLTARYLARGWVRARMGDRLRAIDEGVRRDGAFYLFTLRMIPVVPFFVVNLAMGLTAMRARTFYLASQAGMLAGTAVYVNAGTQLARLDGLSGILTWPVLLSFAALGLMPWAARAAVAAIRRRRIAARWTRPRRFDRNLVVIGGGATGLVAAYVAAAAKAKVTLVEAHRMGGDCLNTGCVPSKALIAAARQAHRMRHADRWGLTPADPPVPFRAVMARVRAAVAAIAPHDSVDRYTALGVEVLQGRARLVDPWTVEVALHEGETRRLTTRATVLATGAAPVIPPVPGIAEVGPLTSDTLWDALAALDAPPARLAVLGGGPIGCEIAQAMARLGSAVTLLEAADRLLLREDDDVSAAAARALAASGVTVLTGHRAAACGTDPDGTRWIEAEGPGGTRRIAFDMLLVATGRAARLAGHGLEELGIPAGRVIETNAWLETVHPNIYAAGDAAGPFQLTHAGAHQAWYAAVNAMLGGVWRLRADYRTIPAATFTDPEIARVGLNEREARARGVPYAVTRYGLEDLDRAIADGGAEGFVKVLTPPGSDRILGATIVGEHAAEMLAEFTLAMRHGLGLSKILATVHPYPTWSEANKYAAGAWRRAHLSPQFLRLAERFHAWRRGDAGVPR